MGIYIYVEERIEHDLKINMINCIFVASPIKIFVWFRVNGNFSPFFQYKVFTWPARIFFSTKYIFTWLTRNLYKGTSSL